MLDVRQMMLDGALQRTLQSGREEGPGLGRP